MGRSPVGVSVIPYMDVEGRGKRPLRYCRTVQDAHTSGEQITYQAIWSYARKFGRSEPGGGNIVDLSVSQLCSLLSTDHKHAKHLITTLEEKLALEVVRQPNCRIAQPTRYRVFNYTQILERRRAAGLVWVIRTRTVRFVDLAAVDKLLAESPAGHSPMGDWQFDAQGPMGQQSDSPAGQPPDPPTGHSPPPLISKEEEEIPPSKPTTLWPLSIRALIATAGQGDDDAVKRIAQGCLAQASDATDTEIAYFIQQEAPRAIQNKAIGNPIGLLIRQVPRRFAGESFRIYREAERARQEAEQESQRSLQQWAIEEAKRILAVGPGQCSESDRQWAEQELRKSNDQNRP